MANKDNNPIFDSSWIPVIVLLFTFWPVGLIMLIRKLSQFDHPTPKAKRKKKNSAFPWPLAVLGIFLISSMSGSIGIGPLPMIGGFAALGGISLYAARTFMRKRDKKYQIYQSVIGKKSSMYIDDIAAAVNVSAEEAISDLQKMIDLNYFLEDSYIDFRLRCFMAHGTAQAPKGEKPAAKEAPREVKANSSVDQQFQNYLSEMRAVNELIEDERVSAQIERIEAITENIFDLIKRQSVKVDQINTFMNYYLPTTLKLLKSYGQMERQSAPGSNIKSSMKNIETMMDQLVFGFEQQLDNLFEANALDISSDIKVLERMMAKDGLSENQYEFPKRTATGLGGAAAAEKQSE